MPSNTCNNSPSIGAPKSSSWKNRTNCSPAASATARWTASATPRPTACRTSFTAPPPTPASASLIVPSSAKAASSFSGTSRNKASATTTTATATSASVPTNPAPSRLNLRGNCHKENQHPSLLRIRLKNPLTPESVGPAYDHQGPVIETPHRHRPYHRLYSARQCPIHSARAHGKAKSMARQSHSPRKGRLDLSPRGGQPARNRLSTRLPARKGNRRMHPRHHGGLASFQQHGLGLAHPAHQKLHQPRHQIG